MTVWRVFVTIVAAWSHCLILSKVISKFAGGPGWGLVQSPSPRPTAPGATRMWQWQFPAQAAIGLGLSRATSAATTTTGPFPVFPRSHLVTC